MTAPDGGSPPGSLGVGLFAARQATTESQAKAQMKSGVIGSFSNAQTVHGAQVRGPIEGQAGSITQLDTRVTSLENGGTLYTYGGNDTWFNPGAGRVGVAVINGGQAGAGSFNFTDGDTAARPAGGVHGGYVYREYLAADLPAEVAITVGAPGSDGNWQLGGFSSFGTILQGISGGSGAMLTRTGAVTSASAPGTGGDGGNANGQTQGQPGLPGGASALATGGAAGNAGSPSGFPGADGGSVPMDEITPCGGGGGGGGGSGTGGPAAPGSGGDGGAPGGGAGGAGRGGWLNSTHRDGGAGGVGRVYVLFNPA